MRHRGIIIASVLVAILAAYEAWAGVVTVFSAVSSGSSGTSSEINTAGPNKFNVQVCGTGLDGTVLVYQGGLSGKLGLTKTITLSGYTGCTEYYWFNPSTLTQIGYTRTAGTIDTITLEYFPAGGH